MKKCLMAFLQDDKRRANKPLVTVADAFSWRNSIVCHSERYPVWQRNLLLPTQRFLVLEKIFVQF